MKNDEKEFLTKTITYLNERKRKKLQNNVIQKWLYYQKVYSNLCETIFATPNFKLFHLKNFTVYSVRTKTKEQSTHCPPFT